jgi:hypothetical protein
MRENLLEIRKYHCTTMLNKGVTAQDCSTDPQK